VFREFRQYHSFEFKFEPVKFGISIFAKKLRKINKNRLKTQKNDYMLKKTILIIIFDWQSRMGSIYSQEIWFLALKPPYFALKCPF